MKPAFPYTELQLKWLEDLKTTSASQADGMLFDGTGYCCLGRACVVMGVEPVKVCPEVGVEYWQFDGHWQFLPRLYRDLGLRGEMGETSRGFKIGDQEFCTLADANDSHCTFEQIAEAIEADPENFFTNSDQDMRRPKVRRHKVGTVKEFRV